MDQQVAEKFAEALAEYAARPRRKQAYLSRTSPYIAFPAISALAGGAAGYFSDDDEKKKLRNMLYGAGIGGLAGLGGAGLAHWYGNAKPIGAATNPAVSLDAPEIKNDPAVVAAGGAEIAKPEGPTLSAALTQAGSEALDFANSGAAADLTAGAAGGLGVRALQARSDRQNFDAGKATQAFKGRNSPAVPRQATENLSRLLSNAAARPGGGKKLTAQELLAAMSSRPPTAKTRTALQREFRDPRAAAQTIAGRKGQRQQINAAADAAAERAYANMRQGTATPDELRRLLAAAEAVRAAGGSGRGARGPGYDRAAIPTDAAAAFNKAGLPPKTRMRTAGRGAAAALGGILAGSAMNSARPPIVAGIEQSGAPSAAGRLYDILGRYLSAGGGSAQK
jgi:hypothetical protein